MFAIRGPPRPSPRARWTASSRELLRALPAELVELLEHAGPGALGGVFVVPDPTSEGFDTLHERFLRAIPLGAWPTLSDEEVSRLVVFATDERGNALAWLDRRYLLLDARGASVLDGWQSLTALTGLLESLHFVFDARAPGHSDRFLEVKAERTWVTVGARGLDDFLSALREGEASLEDALGSRPFALAALETLVALCGPRGDEVPRERRADGVDTLLALVRRSAPLLLEHVLPPQLLQSFDAPGIRAWTERQPTLGPRGPLATLAGKPELERWFPGARERTRGTAWERQASELVDQAERLSLRERARVLHQLGELDDLRGQVRVGKKGLLELDERFARADRAEVQLRASLPSSLPLLQLATMLGLERERVRCTRVLAGMSGLDAFWVLLAGTTPVPAPWGADPRTFAARCLRPDEALIETLLPALRAGSPLAALILRGAAARADVRGALLDVFASVAVEGDWAPPPEIRAHVSAHDEVGAQALCAFLGVRPEPGALDADAAEQGLQAPSCFLENGLRVEPAPAARSPLTRPFRPDAPGPITRALVTNADAGVRRELVRLAGSKRTPLAARDEAVAGLELLGSPEAPALREAVDAAWSRYWAL